MSKDKYFLNCVASDTCQLDDDEWLDFGINGSKKKSKKKKKKSKEKKKSKKKEKKSKDKKGKSKKHKKKDTLIERLIEKSADRGLDIVADGFHLFFEKNLKLNNNLFYPVCFSMFTYCYHVYMVAIDKTDLKE